MIGTCDCFHNFGQLGTLKQMVGNNFSVNTAECFTFSRVLRAPVTDVIYRTVTDNMKTISSQKQALEKMQSFFHKHHLLGSKTQSDLSCPTDSLLVDYSLF